MRHIQGNLSYRYFVDCGDEAKAGLREGCAQHVPTTAALTSMSPMWTTSPESTKDRKGRVNNYASQVAAARRGVSLGRTCSSCPA